MFWIGFGIYTAIMATIWGFFIVAKLHVYKFKDYSRLVPPMTKLLALLLIILTVLGYYFLATTTSTASVRNSSIQEETAKEVY